jgi:glycosyltransferase A (GT-A) superfamily protein (DUF2064 family)
VKTRLCPPLSPAGAASLAEAMLRDVVSRCGASGEFHTVLRYAPGDAGGWFREAFPEIEDQAPQRGSDLGESLALFFDEALELGGTAVVLGSDAPLVPAARVAEAHERLERGADLVLGPDAGGGYYLVGLSRPCARLFTRVQMSTADMRIRTLALAGELGLKAELLSPGYDVDVEADLARLRADLAVPATEAPDTDHPLHTVRALADLLEDRQ